MPESVIIVQHQEYNIFSNKMLRRPYINSKLCLAEQISGRSTNHIKMFIRKDVLLKIFICLNNVNYDFCFKNSFFQLYTKKCNNVLVLHTQTFFELYLIYLMFLYNNRKRKLDCLTKIQKRIVHSVIYVTFIFCL